MEDIENVSVSGTLSFEEFKKAQVYHLKVLGVIAFILSFVVSILVLFITLRGTFLNILFVDL